MKNWNELGVVDTIYEEDCEDENSSTSPPSLSPSLSSPSTPLHSRVDTWTGKTGGKPEVLIRVQGTCFRLHKDLLTSRSAYLKRHLMDVTELTLSPPLNVSPETFRMVAAFCYGAGVVVTPFNVASLATAAALLEMTSEEGGDSGDDLRLVTETYFRRYVTVSREYISILFRSCLDLLPESETEAFLVSQCVEAYSLMEDGEGDGAVDDGFLACFDDVKTVGLEEFYAMVESMQGRLTSNDELYRMVDVYLKEHGGKMADEDKSLICNSVDCTKLSPDILVHAVQNPRMPLRFIIRAMLVEQLRTRRSIIYTCDNNRRDHPPKRQQNKAKGVTTLGAILQRDTAVRHAVQLKAAMDATNSRIQSLEKELTGMKRILHETSLEEHRGSAAIDSARSASFHYGPRTENKIERGERGSVSSISIRGGEAAIEARGGGYSSSLENASQPVSPGGGRKSIRQRLMSGLKNAFGVRNSGSKESRLVSGTEKAKTRKHKGEDAAVLME